MSRTVAILAVPQLYLVDYSIAANVLGERYPLIVCGTAPARADGVTIAPTHGLDALGEADVVVVPGYEEPHLPLPDDYLEAIAHSEARGATILAICTGTFGLAASGITAGRQVTTHWRHTDQLRAMYPDTEVVDNVLFVADGTLLTSAGGGAGIDVCLHLIRDDFGVDVERAAGKSIVAPPTRPGPQPQYVDVMSPPGTDLSETRTWALDNLSAPITVDGLARRSAMARRTFIRRFRDETGMPPMQWLTSQRVLAARRLLETSDWSVDRVAERTGMGTAANFRVLFRRETGLSPSEYRRLHRSR
ncbi:hypothetical protein ALI144C_40905 [Actinosynnema sp. ALI-1.44]|uniref:GlxA family transcriptional regulator n=1 Tax=Actinosynnema sp. ALI-1.44 TaxID=1933779 RepID=UPI00097C53E8|nr:helix-turn-helix domain-containing protein [Actinosynnema sp. ALI-1.44]ONI75112.1 hypothetical protein ALI144C_40905 [Actinosynnema sp. ALI-1.44]